MTPKCPDCRRDQEDCICFPSAKMKRTIDRQAAQIEMMREALESCDSGDYSTGDVIYPSFNEHLVEKALSTTPDQALEQFAAKVREQCAKVCENEYPNTVFQTDQRAAINCANAIRAIKELP